MITLADIKRAKEDLANTIRRLVIDFERDYEGEVNSIIIYRPNKYLNNTSIDPNIPEVDIKITI